MSLKLHVLDKLTARGVTAEVEGGKLLLRPRRLVTDDVLAEVKAERASVVKVLTAFTKEWVPMVESRLEGPGTNDDDDEGNGNRITRSLLTPEEAKDQRLAQVPVQRVRVSATGIEGDEEGETLGYYETMEEADEEIAARVSTLCSTYGCLNARYDDYEFHQCGTCARQLDPDVWRIQQRKPALPNRNPSVPKPRWTGRRVEYNWDGVATYLRGEFLTTRPIETEFRLRLMSDTAGLMTGKIVTVRFNRDMESQPGDWWYQEYEPATHTQKGKQKKAGRWITPTKSDTGLPAYRCRDKGTMENVRVWFQVDVAKSELVVGAGPLTCDEALKLLAKRKKQYRQAKKAEYIDKEPDLRIVEPEGRTDTGEHTENVIMGGVIISDAKDDGPSYV